MFFFLNAKKNTPVVLRIPINTISVDLYIHFHIFISSTATDIPDVDENANKKDSGGDNEVIRTLLIHEMKSGSGPTPTQICKSDSDSDTSESDEEKKHTKPTSINPSNTAAQEQEEEQEEEEGEAVDPVVMVGGQPHVYSEVSQNPMLVSFMTDEEREAYIKIGQQMFQSAFEWWVI